MHSFLSGWGCASFVFVLLFFLPPSLIEAAKKGILRTLSRLGQASKEKGAADDYAGGIKCHGLYIVGVYTADSVIVEGLLGRGGKGRAHVSSLMCHLLASLGSICLG